MKITEAIALEHATLLRVFDQVERVLPGLSSAAEVGTLATILEGLLSTQAQLEANFAFAALDDALRHKGLLAAPHEGHRELDAQLRQVQEASTCEEGSRLLRAAMRAAREHFRHEERDLFPVLERSLGLGVLAALGEAFKKAMKAKATGRRQGGKLKPEGSTETLKS
jgi:hypothetical protein